MISQWIQKYFILENLPKQSPILRGFLIRKMDFKISERWEINQVIKGKYTIKIKKSCYYNVHRKYKEIMQLFF